jgi:hypothetical protein
MEIFGMCLLWRVEISKMDIFTVNANPGRVSAGSGIEPITPALLVASVLGVRCLPQVCEFIVRAVAVPMINLKRGPGSMNESPDKAVREIGFAEYPDHDITAGVQTSGDAARHDPVASCFPAQNPGSFIAGENLLQLLDSYWR